MTHETRKSNTIRAYPSTESVCVGGGEGPGRTGVKPK